MSKACFLLAIAWQPALLVNAILPVSVSSTRCAISTIHKQETHKYNTIGWCVWNPYKTIKYNCHVCLTLKYRWMFKLMFIHSVSQLQTPACLPACLLAYSLSQKRYERQRYYSTPDLKMHTFNPSIYFPWTSFTVIFFPISAHSRHRRLRLIFKPFKHLIWVIIFYLFLHFATNQEENKNFMCKQQNQKLALVSNETLEMATKFLCWEHINVDAIAARRMPAVIYNIKQKLQTENVDGNERINVIPVPYIMQRTTDTLVCLCAA